MARPNRLEAQIAHIAAEFVTKIVAAVHNASFADVAGLGETVRRPPTVTRPKQRRSETATESPPRQTADRRVEIAGRILHALSGGSAPMGARAIANKLDVSPELLVVPLRELRSQGRITKHGDKRSTTYSVT
jgi:hypothetical protein